MADAREPEAGDTTPKDFGGMCGLYWEGNAWYETLGAGCATQEQLHLGQVCPVYACAKERGVAHCGVCPEFPCSLLVNIAAQSGPDDLRIESAQMRAQLGDAAWAEWAKARKMWRLAFCPLRGGPTRT